MSNCATLLGVMLGVMSSLVAARNVGTARMNVRQLASSCAMFRDAGGADRGHMTTGTYATETSGSVERTRNAIERTLDRYGVSGFGYMRHEDWPEADL